MKNGLRIVLMFLILFSLNCGEASNTNVTPNNEVAGGGTDPGDPVDPGDPGEPGDLLTFKADIRPLVEARCSMCHNESSGLPNWLDYQTLFASKDLARERVFVTQEMPRGNATGMTLEEREMFALWVDQGALFE